MKFLMNIKQYAVIALLAFAIGFFAGYKVTTAFNKADVVDGLVKTAEQSQESVNESSKIELKTADAKANIEIRYKTITKEIYKYVPETVYANCTDDTGARVNTTLSTDAVRLLNTTSETADFQPTNSPESQTFTEVGLRELSEYVTAIKKQYEDLAVEHDGLIDYNDYYKGLISQ